MRYRRHFGNLQNFFEHPFFIFSRHVIVITILPRFLVKKKGRDKLFADGIGRFCGLHRFEKNSATRRLTSEEMRTASTPHSCRGAVRWRVDNGTKQPWRVATWPEPIPANRRSSSLTNVCPKNRDALYN